MRKHILFCTLFAAALSLVLMVLTTLMISLYKRITHSSELEGLL